MFVRISYFHSFETVPPVMGPAEGGPDAAVVIDVLRATTTIAWALQNGAEAIQAFADLDRFDLAARAWPAEQRLRAGERGGSRLAGFDLGNSPLAVTRESGGGQADLHEHHQWHPVPGLRAECAPAAHRLPAEPQSAVAARLVERACEQVWIVGSGWEGAYSLEDSLGAGAVASHVMELSVAPHQLVTCGNDEMLAALALWQEWRHDTETCLRAASHGQRLVALGDHDADFACCAAVDTLTIVPMQAEPGVLRAS